MALHRTNCDNREANRPDIQASTTVAVQIVSAEVNEHVVFSSWDFVSLWKQYMKYIGLLFTGSLFPCGFMCVFKVVVVVVVLVVGVFSDFTRVIRQVIVFPASCKL